MALIKDENISKAQNYFLGYMDAKKDMQEKVNKAIEEIRKLLPKPTAEEDNIELVIKLPKEIYVASRMLNVKPDDVVQIPLEVITNGIPLPKGHGALIDKSELPVDIFYDDIVKATVIIPPDSK